MLKALNPNGLNGWNRIEKVKLWKYISNYEMIRKINNFILNKKKDGFKLKTILWPDFKCKWVLRIRIIAAIAKWF